MGQKLFQKNASFYLLLHMTTYYNALERTNAYYYVLREYMVPSICCRNATLPDQTNFDVTLYVQHTPKPFPFV